MALYLGGPSPCLLSGCILPPPPHPPKEADRTVWLAHLGEAKPDCRARCRHHFQYKGKQVNKTEAWTLWKVQNQLGGNQRKLDVYWGSPRERGRLNHVLRSSDFYNPHNLPGSFLVLLTKKPRQPARSRSH